MTPEEADRFIRALESGARFATRFQEQEWGLEALPDGRFREWRRDSQFDPPDEGEDLLTRDALTDLLVRTYSYDILARGLRRG